MNKLSKILFIVILIISITFSIKLYLLQQKYKNLIKEYSLIEQKLNKITEVSTILDSINYEKVDEILGKNIIISDTIITNERTLYLVKKYTE